MHPDLVLVDAIIEQRRREVAAALRLQRLAAGHVGRRPRATRVRSLLTRAGRRRRMPDVPAGLPTGGHASTTAFAERRDAPGATDADHDFARFVQDARAREGGGVR